MQSVASAGCDVEGCNRKLYARGKCELHYRRTRIQGSPGPKELTRYVNKGRTCAIDGCSRGATAKGLCTLHRRRVLRGSTNTSPEPMRVIHSGPCSVSGCERFAARRGMCPMHYQRVWRTGSTELRERPEGTIDNHGYRRLRRPDHPNAFGYGIVLEHTMIMADSLGRRLERYENVHHKNGDRADNRIKKGHEYGGCPPSCCNLELWSTSQPRGQRIPDKIEFTIEILQRYAPEKLR